MLFRSMSLTSGVCAEHPDQLIAYGGSGRRRTWQALDAIVATLAELEQDETLLVQSGTHSPWMK